MSQSGPSGFRKFFSKKVDEDKVEEEILSMVEEGHEQGLIEEGEMELINNIFEFGDKEAKDIMTPRQKIVAVENTQTVEQALQLAVENNFSRYPVYEEDLDNIIGLVHIKDLIAVYMKDPKTPVAGMVDKAIVTHPTKDVSELLQRMQRESSPRQKAKRSSGVMRSSRSTSAKRELSCSSPCSPISSSKQTIFLLLQVSHLPSSTSARFSVTSP